MRQTDFMRELRECRIRNRGGQVERGCVRQALRGLPVPCDVSKVGGHLRTGARRRRVDPNLEWRLNFSATVAGPYVHAIGSFDSFELHFTTFSKPIDDLTG